MTLSEAKEKWNTSHEKLCQWLEYGFIPEVRLNNGIVTVGETKPFVPKKNANITVESVRKYILTACENLEYIDYKILFIEKEQFCAIIMQLEENNYIRKNLPDVDYTTNRNFTITEEGEKFLKKRKFTLGELNFSLNFKYLSLDGKIRKD